MGTTNLFVELVVIGAGVVIWIALLTLSVLGIPSLILGEALLIASAIPMLATIYVAGIIWDRIADHVFERIWTDRWRSEFFTDKMEYYDARRTILTRSDRLSDLLEYGRSRMRICRAWVLNSILIGVSFNIFLFMNHFGSENFGVLLLTANLLSLVFSIGAWFAWASLVKTEYRKISEQSAYLERAGSVDG